MHRRRFVRAAGIAAVSVGLAGCSGSTGGTAVREIDGVESADVVESVGRTAPDAEGPFQDSVEDVPTRDEEELTLDEIIFQRAGERGLVIAGNLTNTSDRSFGIATVQTIIYNRERDTDQVLDSEQRETDQINFEPGETWQWATLYRSEPDYKVNYYTVRALANFA